MGELPGRTAGGTQRAAFLGGEGDAYAARNQSAPPPPEALIDGIQRHLPRASGRLLEIGCGDGRLLRVLRERLGDAWSLHGVDPSADAVRRAATLDGAIEARVGTADEVPLEGTFEAVVLGFFLYVTDRSLLFKVASEVDRLLSSGESDPARLFILDFDPPFPVVRPYRHHPDLSTWKMNYSQIFLSNPDYRLVERCPILRDGPSEDDLISLYILERVAGSGYRPPGEPSHA